MMSENSYDFQLAEKLKQLCDRDGKEKREHLAETTKILHKFGLFYKEQSPDKISLIRSAVFFNAALLRRPNDKAIKTDLKNLCSHVLQIANAKKPDADLIEVSSTVKLMVDEMRAHVNENLKLITNISVGLDPDQLLVKEKDKIKTIEQLQNEVTEKYAQVMSYISDQCKEIMGKSPCEFSVTGMGSLARREITPYSDFEHIIVLEEGVQNQDDYSQILEHFRWFSVIFQIIVINLQETIVRSIAAPSLNDDLVSGGDWFYDSYTTCGIKFDGMQIHACKFPLGRTRTIPSKSETTELIKPISLMVKYLDPNEEEKNGFHLADILTKTCFVAGNSSIHDEFQKQVNDTLKKESTISKLQIAQQLDENLHMFNPMVRISLTNSQNTCDIKRVIYRTTTLFVSALGRLAKIEKSSCFDVVRCMHKRTIINENTEHKLLYAIAIACETRLKVYMKKKGQEDFYGERRYFNDDNNTLLHLIDLVGEQCLGDYFMIAYSLQKVIRSNNILNFKNITCKTTDKFMVLFNLDLLKRLECEWENYCEEAKEESVPNEENFFILYTIGKMKLRNNSYEDALELFELISAASHKFVSSFKDPDITAILPIIRGDAMKEKAHCLVELERFKEALAFIKEAKARINNLGLSKDDQEFDLGSVSFLAGRCHDSLGHYENSIYEFDAALKKFDGSCNPYKKTFIIRCHVGIALAHFRLGNTSQNIKHLTMVYDLHFNSNIEISLIINCCRALHDCYMSLNQPIMAKKYLQEELNLRLKHASIEACETDEDIAYCKARLASYDDLSSNVR